MSVYNDIWGNTAIALRAKTLGSLSALNSPGFQPMPTGEGYNIL